MITDPNCKPIWIAPEEKATKVKAEIDLTKGKGLRATQKRKAAAALEAGEPSEYLEKLRSGQFVKRFGAPPNPDLVKWVQDQLKDAVQANEARVKTVAALRAQAAESNRLARQLSNDQEFFQTARRMLEMAETAGRNKVHILNSVLTAVQFLFDHTRDPEGLIDGATGLSDLATDYSVLVPITEHCGLADPANDPEKGPATKKSKRAARETTHDSLMAESVEVQVPEVQVPEVQVPEVQTPNVPRQVQQPKEKSRPLVQPKDWAHTLVPWLQRQMSREDLEYFRVLVDPTQKTYNIGLVGKINRYWDDLVEIEEPSLEQNLYRIPDSSVYVNLNKMQPIALNEDDTFTEEGWSTKDSVPEEVAALLKGLNVELHELFGDAPLFMLCQDANGDYYHANRDLLGGFPRTFIAGPPPRLDFSTSESGAQEQDDEDEVEEVIREDSPFVSRAKPRPTLG